MKVEKRVQEFIHKHQLCTDGARILVALSGGAENAALRTENAALRQRLAELEQIVKGNRELWESLSYPKES